MNAPTIIVSLIVATILAFVIFRMVRDKKQGKSSCSCGGNCGSCGVCSSQKQEDKK